MYQDFIEKEFIMIFRDFQGKKLSALGMGTMRFPLLNEDQSNIDVEAVKDMVAYAFSKGINYFDTAWGYHGGASETVMGEVLSEYPRNSYFLATKFPGFEKKLLNSVSEVFEKQLEKCKTDYFDFYLFHNVNEITINSYLNPEYKIAEYLKEQKKNGRIRHLGFSTHGTLETVKRFLDAYGDIVEFCQIQFNYLDWDMQDAKAKMELFKERNIPVFVMEPIRGGTLAKIDEKNLSTLKALRPEARAVEWAFRFVQSFPQVAVTLSGMSNFEQLEENIKIFEEDKPLNEQEMNAILSAADSITAKTSLPCTACRYCISHCPKGIDIPAIIELYNDHVFSGGGWLAPMRIKAMDEDKRPSACIACRGCESVCPQNILISEMMADFTEKLSKKQQ